ncbi:MAG: polyhydroxyalkanoate synthase [Cognaticolwellia sp.]
MSPTEGPSTWHRLISDEQVEQKIDVDHSGVFNKQLRQIQCPGGFCLSVVRKRLASGSSRGPVVLVHGLAQNRYTWHVSGRSMANWLAERGWDVWNLELRGHGRSRNADQEEEAFADYVQDIVDVAKSLDGQAVFIGHSLGGAAIYAAAALGAPMKGIVGIGAVFSFAQHNPALRALAELTVAAEAGIPGKRAVVRTRMVGKLLSRLSTVSDSFGFGLPVSGWWPGSVEQELLDERLGNGFDWTSFQVWVEMCQWAVSGRFDPYQEPFRTCGVPLLVIAGDKDHLCGPGDARVPYDLAEWEDKTLRIFDLYQDGVHFGHLDLILGTSAGGLVWPVVHDWMAARGD